MKASAVVLCVATISSLEPLQVVAPKEPRQWREHQSGNARGQNPWHTHYLRDKPYSIPQQRMRQNLGPLYGHPSGYYAPQGAPDVAPAYSQHGQQPQSYYYPSGGYVQHGPPGRPLAYSQHSQYNVAANMMHGASTSGFPQPPLPTSEQNDEDQTLNNAILTGLSMLTESITALEWLESKLAGNQAIQLEADRQEAQICAQFLTKSAIILSVNRSQCNKKGAYIRLCDVPRLKFRKVVQPAIEKGDGTKRDIKLVFRGKEHSYTLQGLYIGRSQTGMNLHAAFAFNFGSTQFDIKSGDSVTLYEV